MKKLFLLLALLGMVAVGCSKDEVDKGNDNKTEQPDENEDGNEENIPENIFFGLDKESVTIYPEGGSVDVIVYSNYKWEISGTSDWCIPSAKGGDANEDGQKVTFTADVAYDDREATFWFRCADEKIKFVVSQKFKETIIPDANNTFNIPSEGGVAVISYQTSVDCEVIIPEEAQDWITIAPATRGLVSENINLDIAENTTYSARTGVIKVVAKDNAELTVEYTINQEQNDAILADENNTFDFPVEGGVATINYHTNVECDIIIPEDAQDWIALIPETRGLVAKSAILQISENTTYRARTAVVKVVAKDNAELVVEYTINQVQNNAILADENNTFTVPSAGGEVAINYQTNIDCEVIIPEEAQDWVTIAPATRGLVSKSITLNVAENTTYSARTAVIKVVAKDNAELAIEYTINQVQNDAVLANGNIEFIIEGWEQQITIEHKANVDCDVIIPDEAQDWVTIAPATRGLSTYSTTLNIAENNSGEERSCVVKVVSQGDNKLSAEYTIIQNPRYCLYYTSSNGKIVKPNNSSAFGATIISNTYKDGAGAIDFNAPITAIGDEAFKGCSSLTSVTIGDSVTTIGGNAFEYCSSLTSVTIPNSVTTIGDSAFAYCRSLTSVTIPNSVTEIGGSAFYGCTSLTSVTILDSVTSIGYAAFRGCSSLTSVTIPDSVTKIDDYAFLDCSSLTSVTIGDSVTTIGGNAFSGCSSLTSVTIPDSVTKIGERAFYGCSSLTSVTIPDSVNKIGNYTFNGCSSLTSVTIPDSVTAIGKEVFYGCKSLTSVTIPDSVTTIGMSAFYKCSSLTSITIPDSVTKIGGGAFGWCDNLKSITIPNSVTKIEDEVFRNCSNLTSMTIPDSVTKIGGGAFGWCDNLKSITIPDSVTTIGDGAFYDCSSLESINIPDSVTKIGADTFRGCSSLTSITIPNRVTKIGNSTFYNCESLTSVTIGDSVTTIGEYTFYNCSSLTSVTIPDSVTTIGDDAFYNCSSLTSVTIPDSVTTIGNSTFQNCSSLTSVTIPDSVTAIGKEVFYGCKSLTSVTIGNSVTTIGDEAFRNCSSLTSITIPDSVTTIGEQTFCDCSSLKRVYCKPTTPPIVLFDFGHWGAFDSNASGRNIYVPTESVNMYMIAEGWNDYWSDIVGYNF